MKVYSIGREMGCDIIIDDNSDVISRRHATLNVMPSGKMTIIDLSHNGTYVNGIRINQNVPVPVTRNDTVSFAHVAQLDWNQIPNTQGMIVRYVLLALLAILLVIGGVWAYSALTKDAKPVEPQPTSTTAVDSTEIKKKEEKMKEAEKEKLDSIKKHVQDSLNKVRQQKKAAGGKAADNKNKGGDKNKAGDKGKTDNKKAEPKKEEPKKRFH